MGTLGIAAGSQLWVNIGHAQHIAATQHNAVLTAEFTALRVTSESGNPCDPTEPRYTEAPPHPSVI